MTEPTTADAAQSEGGLLKSLLEGRDINQQELADCIETSRVAVNQVINHKRGLTPLMALKLEASLGIPARPILERQLIRELDEAYQQNKETLERIRGKKKPASWEKSSG
jgi:plasmid maintenance system antidote protein VapI